MFSNGVPRRRSGPRPHWASWFPAVRNSGAAGGWTSASSCSNNETLTDSEDRAAISDFSFCFSSSGPRARDVSVLTETQMRKFSIIVIFLSIVAPACKQAEGPATVAKDETHVHGTPKDWKFTLPAGNAAAGRKIFVEAECHKCHEVTGEKFPDIAK